MAQFNLKSKFNPAGDQPEAIKSITEAFLNGEKYQTLLGVTGSGKTFTMANVIKNLGKKTLILAHNKTLAAQLYSEFRDFFPDHAVEFFVSYYDYYQPEAYVPSSDVYIDKDASINDEIDKLRHSATLNLLESDSVVVISSVSCIYGIGSPEQYSSLKRTIFVDETLDRDELIKDLISIQYSRNDIDLTRGTFRVRGESIDIFPPSEDSYVYRIEFFDDNVEAIYLVDPLRGVTIKNLNKVSIYPQSHYAVSTKRLEKAIKNIQIELRERLIELESQNKLVEKQRLEQRTLLDIEMMEELGYCSGIENYSRHLIDGVPGAPAPTLIDYFKNDFLLIIDESHMTIPQVRGMYNGDRARKENLVNYGFRLPSALDNRPLKFVEFESKINQVLYVSATPADYELEKTKGEVVEQIIRPTGLLDPVIQVRDAKNQVDDVMDEAKKTIAEGFRVLITTLTKKLAEELTNYLVSCGLKVRYLHSDIDTIERVEILRDLRLGEFDILVGINLLREGLDLPEVALVAILDADKEGFLRSERALVQTIGRAARNSEGKVLMYGYKETKSMKKAISETLRRRKLQIEHNKKLGITPKTILKDVSGGVIETLRGTKNKKRLKVKVEHLKPEEIDQQIKRLKKEMKIVAKELKFEEAAKLRDEINLLSMARLEL